MTMCASSSMIGVIGSISGVLIGFFLQRINNFGKIKLFRNTCSYKIYETDGIGGFIEVPEVSTGESNFQSQLALNLDLFNSKPSTVKIMRDIKIEIHHQDCPKYIYNLSPRFLIIPPKHIIPYNQILPFHQRIFDIKKTKIKLTYRNERNRLKSFNIEPPSPIENAI